MFDIFGDGEAFADPKAVWTFGMTPQIRAAVINKFAPGSRFIMNHESYPDIYRVDHWEKNGYCVAKVPYGPKICFSIHDIWKMGELYYD